MNADTARKHLLAIAERADLGGFYSAEVGHVHNGHLSLLKRDGYLTQGPRKKVVLTGDHGVPQLRGRFAITAKGRALLGEGAPSREPVMDTYAALITKAEQAQALLEEVAASPTLRSLAGIRADARFASTQALRVAQKLRTAQADNPRRGDQ